MRKILAITMVWGIALLSGCAGNGQPDQPEKPSIAPPVIPNKSFTITDFGAVGDGKTMNTQAIQKAIDTCTAAGGGTVVVPAGKYLTSPLKLASNLNLDLQMGSTILISNKMSDFKNTGDRYEPCILAAKCHDISITGSGTIDGQGDIWWKAFRANPDMPHRPFMVRFENCQRILVQGVSLVNSPMFHLVPKECQDVTIDGITINAPANSKNTDGIDPSGFNYLITNCTIDTGDDCIAVKATDQIDPKRPSVENMLITHCTFRHGHGMSVGGQTNGGLRHMVVRDCSFDGTEAGIRLKAPRGKGGVVEDLTYENLTMKNVKWAISISSYYPESSAPKDLSKATSRPAEATTPVWRNIRINNVTAVGGEYAGRIIGLPEMHITDIVLTNVNISAQKSLTIAEADDIKFVNSKVTVSSGKPLMVINGSVEGIDPDSGQ